MSGSVSGAPTPAGVVAQGSSADIDALERAAMRVRPSWENLEPVTVPNAPPLSATLLGTAPAPDNQAELVTERTTQRPTPQVDPAASIIVNEPGVIVLDAPPPGLDMSKPEPPSLEPVIPIPQVQRGADMLSGASHQETARHVALPAVDDDDIAPPMTSRRPWLWAVGGAALGLAVLVLTLGRSEPTSARLTAPSAKAAAAPESPLPAPVVVPDEPAQVEPPVEAMALPEPEAPPALPAVVEPAADEPAREPVETKATRKRKARLAAQQRAQEPVTRVAKAPAAKAAPATAPSAQAASKKKGKGAGFVSANPYQ